MTPLDDETFDRLLMSLPLDEPPAGARERVLAAIAAPRPLPVVRPWEARLAATALAVMVWLLGMVVFDAAFGAAIADVVGGAVRATAAVLNLGSLAWVGIGALATFCISQLTLIPVPQRKQR